MSERLLVLVDDEPDILEVAATSLDITHGWDVRTATSGPEGISLAARIRPDLVILDMMMPETDGPATLERMRADERTRDVPVIFMTAKMQHADREALLALGPAGLLPKPFDPMTLGNEISRIMGWEP